MGKFNVEINMDISKDELESKLGEFLYGGIFYVNEKKPVNKKIVIYTHLSDISENHEEINREIVQPIIDSGLINHSHLKFFCHYNRDSFSWLESMFLNFDNVEFFYPDVVPSDYEIYTINQLREDCIRESEDRIILYVHSKGITKPYSKPSRDWRRYLVHFNIERWVDNVALLEHGFDTVGVNLLESPLHYSGNFWWSKSAYIKNLPEIPRFVNRHYAETWICSGYPKACEVFNSQIEHWHYDVEYPEENYRMVNRFNRSNSEINVAVPGVSGCQVPYLLDRDRDLVGIELGCAFGVTTEHLLRRLKGTLHGIDPYENYIDWNKDVLDTQVNLSNFNKLMSATNEFGNRFILHKKTSDESVVDFEDASIDYIFIDGLHTYEQVLRDCINYYPKLKPGGLFSGHDYNAIVDVRRAVDEFASSIGAEVKTGLNDSWYWFKEEKTP
jgi:hypothetical protein